MKIRRAAALLAIGGLAAACTSGNRPQAAPQATQAAPQATAAAYLMTLPESGKLIPPTHGNGNATFRFGATGPSIVYSTCLGPGVMTVAMGGRSISGFCGPGDQAPRFLEFAAASYPASAHVVVTAPASVTWNITAADGE